MFVSLRFLDEQPALGCPLCQRSKGQGELERTPRGNYIFGDRDTRLLSDLRYTAVLRTQRKHEMGADSGHPDVTVSPDEVFYYERHPEWLASLDVLSRREFETSVCSDDGEAT